MKKIQYKIVDDIGVGIKINKNFNHYYWIKTEKQYIKWKKDSIAFCSGTYGTNDLIATIENFISPLSLGELALNQSPTYKSYIDDLKRILNK